MDDGAAGFSPIEKLDFRLARRGFVMTSLIAGFTLATTRVEAQAIHTDAAGLDSGPIDIPVSDGKLPGFFARPAGGTNLPIVLVVEEIFGVHEYIKDICRRLAKLGYLAVAPELYARLGDLSKMTDPGQIFRDVISKAPDATVMSDLDATAAWAAADGWSFRPARRAWRTMRPSPRRLRSDRRCGRYAASRGAGKRPDTRDSSRVRARLRKWARPTGCLGAGDNPAGWAMIALWPPTRRPKRPGPSGH